MLRVDPAWNDSWKFLTKELSKAGYCVFQLKYGQIEKMPMFGGLRDIRESAKELAVLANKLLETTGAEKIDLIAHSEGTVVTRWYIKFVSGDRVVDSVVSVTPVGRGTSLMGIVSVFKTLGWFNGTVDIVQRLCPACVQLLQDSDVMKELYADDQEIVVRVRYLNLVTRNDEMITPFTNGLMRLEQMEVKGAQDDTRHHQPVSPPLSESRNLIMEDY
ncbi:MAG: hypothetical protein J3Q66DRAFT_434933 [Benniella sp.]|nr:MAG: hypothetical protein J3Q66DRAFT_434933 [Benniella sp.]